MAYQIDNSHSTVQFAVRHMMLSKTRGEFERFSGDVNLNEENPVASTVDVKIEAASVNTRDAKRDEHLRSPDFFDAARYPYLTFKSTKVDVLDSERAKLHGDLTIRDITKPVTLDVEYNGQSKSPWGTTNYGFSGRTKINRKDFGLEWNVALETGGFLVGDDINIDIELELVKQA